jgi:hypothetical protein
MDTFLSYIFICLKDHKWRIIIWIIIMFLKYFPWIAKLTCSKFDTNKKCFCTFKALKLWEWTIFVFFKCLFFPPNVHHFFWKLKSILRLMITKAKGFELMIYFYNWFEHIWFKSVFNLENYGFKKCALNKSYSHLCDKRHECIIYMI